MVVPWGFGGRGSARRGSPYAFVQTRARRHDGFTVGVRVHLYAQDGSDVYELHRLWRRGVSAGQIFTDCENSFHLHRVVSNGRIVFTMERGWSGVDGSVFDLTDETPITEECVIYGRAEGPIVLAGS